MKIETKDEIVLAVLKKMDERSLVGQEKYGATMMEEIVGEKKDLHRFLVDVQEEIMDALLYIEAAKRCLQDEVEEQMLAQFREMDPLPEENWVDPRGYPHPALSDYPEPSVTCTMQCYCVDRCKFEISQ